MSSIEKSLQTAKTLLSRWAETTETPEENRLDVVLASDDVLPAVKVLHETEWGYLAAITGLDLGPEDGRMEVLYHFCAGAAVITLRARSQRDSASVPSVCGVIPSASFFERELSEMFGVTVVDTPNPDRLFLPDDWPAGVYPLRKDFELSQVEG